MINKIKGIINEFLLHYTLLFLSVKGETGSGKTQLIRAFQKVYFPKKGYQSMIFLHTLPTGLIKRFIYRSLISCRRAFFKNVKNILMSTTLIDIPILMNSRNKILEFQTA